MIRILGIPIYKEKLKIFMMDGFIIAVSVYIAVSLRFGSQYAFSYLSQNMAAFILQGCIYLTCFYVADIYYVRRNYTVLGQALVIFTACIAGMLLSAFLFYSRLTYIGRGVFLITAALIFILSTVARSAYATYWLRKKWMSRVLIIGAGNTGKILLKEIKANVANELWVVGFIDDDPGKQGLIIDNKPVLGTSSDILRIARECGVDIVALCINNTKNRRLIRSLLKCHYTHITVVDMPWLFECITGKLPLTYINDEWMLYSAMHNQMLVYKKIKRLLDIVFSLLLLAATSPLLVISAIFVQLSSKGGVFYSQERIGLDYKIFRIYKLRTMVQDAERDTGAIWASKDDPRVTIVGRYLRRLRIDEIPQLFNVMKGDMSFVGPRPERDEFVKELEKDIPLYGYRFLVKPGITGWAQVMYPYASTKEQSIEKLQYDLYYIKNISVLLDFLIMLKTIKTIFMFNGY